MAQELLEDASDPPHIVDAARDRGQPFSAGGDAENLERLVAGAGASNPGAGSGISLHGKLRLMLRAGLNSAAATSTPAGIFGVDDRWRIDQSRIADLVLVDDYLAGRFLSDREVYLQVDPSGGGRRWVQCADRATWATVRRATRSPRRCRNTPRQVEHIRGRLRHRRSRLYRLLLTGEVQPEARASSLQTFTNWAARTGQIVAYEYFPSGRRLFRVCPCRTADSSDRRTTP